MNVKLGKLYAYMPIELDVVDGPKMRPGLEEGQLVRVVNLKGYPRATFGYCYIADPYRKIALGRQYEPWVFGLCRIASLQEPTRKGTRRAS
ncbi:MAG: hypothetical protein H0U97_12145 [Gammaproteobacteria bacterium]|nr:hypothetical protein [Gammaproteobacteria bacterium]